MQPQPITVAIGTRNRGAAVATAVRSVLLSDHPNFRLLVIDQSSDTASQRAVEPFLQDPRFRYVSHPAVGVSRARNLALRLAETEIVAFTDDDCEVPPSWLAMMQSIFAEYPDVIQAFCSVRPGPHDPAREFVPAYICRETRLFREIADKYKSRGMGAGMALRRQPILAIGGFDEEIGPGSTFPSCEEGDLMLRVLMNGRAICETDRTFVLHHGSRTWAEGKQLAQRDWVGIGAVHAKPLRVGEWGVIPAAVYEFAFEGIRPAFIDLLHARRPRGLGRALYFLRGFTQALRAPFDRDRLLFKATAD